MVAKRVKFVKEWWLDNTSYKVISLVVAVVLWSLLVGRKEVLVRTEIVLIPKLRTNQAVGNSMPDSVRVELKGTRLSVAKYELGNPKYNLDLTNLSNGRQIVRLSRQGLNTSDGVRVLSVQPEELIVLLRRASSEPNNEQDGM